MNFKSTSSMNPIFIRYIKQCSRQLISMMLVAMTALPVKAAPTISKQYQIVSSFLLQLTSFTVWKNNQTDFVSICIFGYDPFGQYIDEMLKRQPKNRAGQLITVKRLHAHSEFQIEQCHIVYTDQQDLMVMWQQLPAKHHALLVSQHQDFISQGGMVNFAYQNKRVKLEINLPAVQDAGLNMSSVLLKHASIINGKMLKKATIESAQMQASIIGASISSAIIFHDNNAAKMTLALFANNDQVEFSAIYLPDGTVFALSSDVSIYVLH